MKIVGVTSCSTGIAHTYMSAGGIEKSCKRAGIEVKVETQGSIGVENRLSQAEVDSADLVIFAAGLPVIDVDRFKDKIIFDCGMDVFIKNPTKALEEALAYYNDKKNS